MQNFIFKNTIVVAVFLACFIFNASAQISPGDLTKAHAHLEGITNCTKCHVLGDKVSNEKCLDCHKEIKTRVDAKKGYHASTDVKGKDCFTCHSDHHGRSFEIIRFDTEAFNHELTGYKMTGAHKKLDCIACHKSELIGDAEIKRKKRPISDLKRSVLLVIKTHTKAPFQQPIVPHVITWKHLNPPHYLITPKRSFH